MTQVDAMMSKLISSIAGLSTRAMIYNQESVQNNHKNKVDQHFCMYEWYLGAKSQKSHLHIVQGDSSLVWKASKGGDAKNFSSTNFKVNTCLLLLRSKFYIKRAEDHIVAHNKYNQHWQKHQEHIHVYKPMEGAADAGIFAAPFHTDNGLLLMVTPFQVFLLLIIPHIDFTLSNVHNCSVLSLKRMFF